MKLEHLVGDRFKERPADCQVDSHALMVRGGYIKYVANGIYSSYPPLKRVLKKLEQIMREEMDALDGQEVQFPVVMPASLWAESGRYESIGKELLLYGPQRCRYGAGYDPRGGCGATGARIRRHLHQVPLYDLSNSDQVPG